MSEQRYGDYEQVNGATANAANDRAEKAEKQRDELLAALTEYIAAADETVHGEDCVAAMLRFGEASEAARAVIAKIEASK